MQIHIVQMNGNYGSNDMLLLIILYKNHLIDMCIWLKYGFST